MPTTQKMIGFILKLFHDSSEWLDWTQKAHSGRIPAEMGNPRQADEPASTPGSVCFISLPLVPAPTASAQFTDNMTHDQNDYLSVSFLKNIFPPVYWFDRMHICISV